MSDNAAEVEVLDDEASAFLTKDEIIGLIRALPDPLCGYSSWIFVGLCDIAEALLAGRDVVKTVSELEGSLSDEARQTAIAFTAVSALRQKALAFERKYGQVDIAEEFDGACDFRFKTHPDIKALLDDIDETIMVLIDERDDEGEHEDLLRMRLRETSLPYEKRSMLSRVYDSLTDIQTDVHFDDVEEIVRPLESVSDEELERLIGKLPAKQRALYAFMHNRLLGRILAKTGDRLSVAEELLQEEMEDEDDRQAVLEQIVWSARLSPRIQPSAERFAPKGNTPSDRLIRPLLEKMEDDIDVFMPLADGLRTLYTTAAALEGTELPALSRHIGDEDSGKEDKTAAELAEMFLMLGGFNSDFLDADYPGRMVSDGEAIWRALRTNLSTAEAHRIGQALCGVLFPLTKLGDDDRIYQCFNAVGQCPDDELFCRTQEWLVPLMAASGAYVDIEGPIPDSISALFHPKTAAEAEKAARTVENLIERFPSVLKALPDEIQEDVVVAFFSAGILGQGLLRLPEEMRRELYECEAGDDDFLAVEDELTSILVMLGVQADKLLAEQDGRDRT